MRMGSPQQGDDGGIHLLGDIQNLQGIGNRGGADGAGNREIIDGHDVIGLVPLDFLPDMFKGVALVHGVIDPGFVSRFQGGPGQVGKVQRRPGPHDLYPPAVVRGCNK
jgi:hypothetical protein